MPYCCGASEWPCTLLIAAGEIMHRLRCCSSAWTLLDDRRTLLRACCRAAPALQPNARKLMHNTTTSVQLYQRPKDGHPSSKYGDLVARSRVANSKFPDSVFFNRTGRAFCEARLLRATWSMEQHCLRNIAILQYCNTSPRKTNRSVYSVATAPPCWSLRGCRTVAAARSTAAGAARM